MDRRAFLGILAGSLLAAPLGAEGQQAGKPYRIGVLLSSAGFWLRVTGIGRAREPDLIVAWPTAEISVMGPEGGRRPPIRTRSGPAASRSSAG